MKRLWIAIGILLLAAVLCVSSLWAQRSAISQLEEELADAEALVRAGDLNAAMEKTLLFQEDCVRADRRFDLFSRHEENCPLQQSAFLLSGLLQEEALTDYFTEVNRCRFFLEELRQAEEPLFGNIF